METITNLGINTVNLKFQKALELGLSRVELCLGKGDYFDGKFKRFYEEIEKAESLKLPYSIHLPVYVEDWYPYDFFSAFFLDPIKEKRELSFRLLEYNLKKLRDICSPEYFVLHFPGIFEKWRDSNGFSKILKESLSRVNRLAKSYGVKVYLEYFGSNKNFYDYNEWISNIDRYENLGILTDTGHLHFASISCGFDFMEALKILAEGSDAFHLWTTRGEGTYCGCEYYRKYHHIGPHIDQLKDDGWAFNTGEVVELIAKENKPIIIEPSIKYKGIEYLIEGIESIKKYF